jgi:hypothetical protein
MKYHLATFFIFLASCTLGQVFAQSTSGAVGSAAAHMTQSCAGVCHGPDRFATQHRSREAWRRTVLQMVSNGAQLYPDEIDAIVTYLAENFGERPSGRATAAP